MASIQKMRERMAGIHSQRGEHWKDFLLKITTRPRRPFRRQFRDLAHANAVLCQLGHQFVLPQRVLRRHEFAHHALDTVKCLGCTQTVRPHVAGLALYLLLDPGDANLKKLIQVRAENGKELDAFDEGLGGILRFFQNAAIELEPAQLAIDKILRIRKTLFLRNVLLQDFHPCGGVLGNTGLGNGCWHLSLSWNPRAEKRARALIHATTA